MKIFIAGVMRGSVKDTSFTDQNYRKQIKHALLEVDPSYEVIDPLENCDKDLSNKLSTENVWCIFHKQNKMCRDANVLIAYLPESSMGTAIEMWEAHQAHKIVISITDMPHNWTIRLLSHKIYPSLKAFLWAVSQNTWLTI